MNSYLQPPPRGGSTDSSVSVKLFADDVKLYTVISDEFSCDKLRISLDNIGLVGLTIGS